MYSIRVAVACTDASGVPTLVPLTLITNEQEYADGLHYHDACEVCEDRGYEGPMVVFDENDYPGLIRFAHAGYSPNELIANKGTKQ